MKDKIIELPCFGIKVIENKGGGSIRSDLHTSHEEKNREYEAAINALESLILGHACAGVDIESPVYIEGIETAVEAISNNY